MQNDKVMTKCRGVCDDDELTLKRLLHTIDDDAENDDNDDVTDTIRIKNRLELKCSHIRPTRRPEHIDKYNKRKSILMKNNRNIDPGISLYHKYCWNSVRI